MIVELEDEEIVRELLAHLHNAHDRSVYLILSILEHSFLGRLLLLALRKTTRGDAYVTSGTEQNRSEEKRREDRRDGPSPSSVSG